MTKYIKLFENFTEKIIAYHGTNKIFDKFDIKFSGSSNDPGDYGLGIYFDTNIEWSAAYSHKHIGFVMTAEISLINPYCINFKKYNIFKKEHIRDQKNNSELLNYIETLNNGGANITDFDNNCTFLTLSRKYGSENITKFLTNAGYDGVIVDYSNSKEIVVFFTDDIKIKNIQKTSDLFK